MDVDERRPTGKEQSGQRRLRKEQCRRRQPLQSTLTKFFFLICSSTFFIIQFVIKSAVNIDQLKNVACPFHLALYFFPSQDQNSTVLALENLTAGLHFFGNYSIPYTIPIQLQ